MGRRCKVLKDALARDSAAQKRQLLRSSTDGRPVGDPLAGAERRARPLALPRDPRRPDARDGVTARRYNDSARIRRIGQCLQKVACPSTSFDSTARLISHWTRSRTGR